MPKIRRRFRHEANYKLYFFKKGKFGGLLLPNEGDEDDGKIPDEGMWMMVRFRTRYQNGIF